LLSPLRKFTNGIGVFYLAQRLPLHTVGLVYCFSTTVRLR
jgi:hypothetical protein